MTITTSGKFYLGRTFDPVQGKVIDQPVLYDPADLTTHAVVVGMTGSGKTGLCIDMLEEAALNGIPALLIDPKGDITNLLLHFPDLAPQDFQPWVNPDEARRAGKSIDQAAVEAATQWRQGLMEWGIDQERLLALKNAARFTIYTPGSDVGVSVSILASLKAPPIPWEGNREILREKITSTVTALLSLVGLQDIDPVRSREHILLSNIFENAWSQGRDLDLGELILQTQTPPFPKLGVFDVNTFFPEKNRFSLAMLLNNILAAPAFQTWIEGQPLEIQNLLYTEDGRPRHSIFYIAHLTDTERMFFVTLLFSAVETWMRSQPGTTALRAIVYFDEIFGYMPPTANPPSKQPMLRMLKQARAFGVGLTLVTQNPVDMDYKALSNAGTWFIGKLQTDQDKQRLLDGLQGAMSGNLDRSRYDKLISTLGKRVFLLHNVHESQPMIFQTRWAMNYLVGPLTRTQIPLLNKLSAPSSPTPPAIVSPQIAGPSSVAFPQVEISELKPVPIPQPVSVVSRAVGTQSSFFNQQPTIEDRNSLGSSTRPTLPMGVKEFFLPNNLTFTQAFKSAGKPFPQEAFSQGLLYRPVILAQASLRFLNRKYNLDTEFQRTALVVDPDQRGGVRWENHRSDPIDPGALNDAPDPQARYSTPGTPFMDIKLLTALEKDFMDWAYRTGQVTVHVNESLGLYAGPEVSSGEFRTLCAEAARQGRDDEDKKITTSYGKKLTVLKEKLAREERELSVDQTDLSQHKMEELGTHAENVLSFFGGRRSSRRLSTSLTKRRLTEQAKADVDESREAIQDFKAQIDALEKEQAQALQAANDRWGGIVNQVSELTVAVLKKDVLLELFGVAWMPFHVVKIGEEIVELPGFRPKQALE